MTRFDRVEVTSVTQYLFYFLLRLFARIAGFISCGVPNVLLPNIMGLSVVVVVLSVSCELERLIEVVERG